MTKIEPIFRPSRFERLEEQLASSPADTHAAIRQTYIDRLVSQCTDALDTKDFSRLNGLAHDLQTTLPMEMFRGCDWSGFHWLLSKLAASAARWVPSGGVRDVRGYPQLASLRLLCGRSEWETARASMGDCGSAVEALCRISAAHGRMSGRPTTELPELPCTEVRDER